MCIHDIHTGRASGSQTSSQTSSQKTSSQKTSSQKTSSQKTSSQKTSSQKTSESKTETEKGTETEREANREIKEQTLASMSKRFRVCARRKMHKPTHTTPTSHLIVAKNYIKINRCVCVFVRARV